MISGLLCLLGKVIGKLQIHSLIRNIHYISVLNYYPKLIIKSSFTKMTFPVK